MENVTSEITKERGVEEETKLSSCRSFNFIKKSVCQLERSMSILHTVQTDVNTSKQGEW